MLVQVGWQIQQRNFRLGASVPIGMHDNPFVLLSAPFFFFFFFFFTTRTSLVRPFSLFLFPTAVVHSSSEQHRTQSLASLSQPDCQSFILHHRCRRLDHTIQCPPPRKTPCAGTPRPTPESPLPRIHARRRIAHVLPRHSQLKHASSNTFDPPRRPPAHLFWHSETRVLQQ
ncbi:hypothetical protein IWX50DRAFT_302999 [Phyllosticta citricarpa]